MLALILMNLDLVDDLGWMRRLDRQAIESLQTASSIYRKKGLQTDVDRVDAVVLQIRQQK